MKDELPMNTNARIVFVTGGSRGIGAAVARKAAQAGFDVAINYVSDAAAAESVAADVRAAGRRALVIKGDVSVEADVVAMFEAVDTGLGPLTALVNNAGITGRTSRLDVAAPDVIRSCIDINVTGAILVAKEAILRMSTRHGGKGGTIVNISSVAATLGSAGDYVWYAASKGAIDSLTVGLAKELATENIRVNAVSPGLIDTEIHDRSSHDAARVERYRPMIPMERIGRAEEIADAVLYFLSDAASYVTGANLRVSGGR
jgi:NAD(P)-dependent dehydrogenase (short-subunit alcohol dehydrogenase family)